MEVARQRAVDAEALAKEGRELAAVYLAGYGIECVLKAYLQRLGVGFPRAGSSGHNIRALWAKCEFSLAELNDQRGCTAYYVRKWSTSLRYQTEAQDLPCDTRQMVRAAGSLVGWVTNRVRR